MGEEEGARRKRKRDEKRGQERKTDLFLECGYPNSGSWVYEVSFLLHFL